jgi:hypothetical protein
MTHTLQASIAWTLAWVVAPSLARSDDCGAVTACSDYDLTQAKLQVATEFCGQESGMHTGAVTLHSVQLVEPSCE